ncbi:hypothetical protein [Streptomyces sp. NPDC088725]|uniref:hypothetical protein n=1 Tax=Streptomyces sp. NPDC088725 TaxID=3365873 RepID=UPI0037F858AE
MAWTIAKSRRPAIPRVDVEGDGAEGGTGARHDARQQADGDGRAQPLAGVGMPCVLLVPGEFLPRPVVLAGRGVRGSRQGDDAWVGEMQPGSGGGGRIITTRGRPPANFDLVLGADGQARIIEANPRLSGDSIPRLHTAAYGVNVVGALVALALGEPYDEHLVPTRNEHAAVELVGSPLVTDGELVAWDGVAAARNIPGITDVVLYAEPGDLVRPHDQSGHKIGMFVAAGQSVADVSLALEAAGALLRPIIRPTTVGKGES